MSSTPSLNPEQNIRYQKILTNPNVDFVKFVSVENLVSASTNNGKVQISIPNSSHSLTFQVAQVEYESEENYYRYGTYEDTLA
ncbi:MAG: hypothetical protein ACK40K_08065, partial [Raineya sp.]